MKKIRKTFELIVLGLVTAFMFSMTSYAASSEMIHTGSLSAEQIENTIISNIENNLIITNTNGEEAEDVVFQVSNCDVLFDGEGGYANVGVDLYLPNRADGNGNVFGTGTDSSGSVRFNMTIYFTLSDYNGQTYGVLTRFTGNYVVTQSGVSVSNNRVNYYTTGSSPEFINVYGQENTYYVTSFSFAKYTGYTIPVLLSAHHDLGAAWLARINRGGSSWEFSMPVRY